MDDMRAFDHQGQNEAHDAGVEAPPVIGTDERRMHVRAYNYWVSLLDGRAYPSIEDLDPASLDDFGPHSVLLDFTNGTDNPAIAWLGGKLRAECDLASDIAAIDEVPSRSLLSRLTDHYLQIIANRAPIGFEAEFVNQRGANTMYRGILMPFSTDDDTIDFIYGVINWKEVAEGELAQSIQSDVDRVLAETPIPHTESVPVWADGPASHALDETPITVDDSGDQDNESFAFEPDGTEGLADWLAAARESVDVFKRADSRSRAALYRALGLAYDFALVADARPDDYATLLEDTGLVAQERAPMTPIAKLVFGVDYDKTRLTEFAAALTFARREGIAAGGFASLLESYKGGLKGVVAAERATRRPATAVARVSPARERARKLEPQAILNYAGDEEFVVIVARRLDAEHVAVLGVATGDDALIDKALRGLKRA
jgi:hypothetical protein